VRASATTHFQFSIFHFQFFSEQQILPRCLSRKKWKIENGKLKMAFDNLFALFNKPFRSQESP